MLRQAEPEERAAAALLPLSLDDAVRSRLATVMGGSVRATVQLIPYEGLNIAADWPDATDAIVEPVMSVAASTRALAQMMIPRRVEFTLDLGCGSGVMALLAARQSERVWAVDLNPRAVAMTAFNAALNGVANIEARAGDVFDPVRDRTFDLIVCNPPFVIAPTAGRLHSQTGRPADDFCRSIVRAAPEFLRPGGFCQLVGNWVRPIGGDWQKRLAQWFDGLDCDVLVLHARSEDAATYARRRIAETTDDPADAARRFDEWIAYYQRAGIEAIEFGIITMRRSPRDRKISRETGWFHCEALSSIADPCGANIEREFARRDSLGSAPRYGGSGMSSAPITSYDELPYDDHVFAYSQPANLATVAALHGLNPPPMDRCRVLDIGCAAGANLLPMALDHPESGFVGLDLSPRQIAAGRDTVARLGLSNVALHARSILDPTDDLGTFDFIICHGVYSWVPSPVQDGILDLIRRHLNPAGLAYISYNTFPGWHLRGITRDVMGFHAAGVTGGPPEKTAHARAFLDFLIDSLPEQDTAYANILRRDADLLRTSADSYVYHEYLEANNRPVYFHQFAAHAETHGLQYLAEASPQPLPGNLKPGVLDLLATAAGDRIRMEQYIDFLRCRIFRRSVLCHMAARPDFSGAADSIPMFAVSSQAKPEADAPDPDPAKREMFVVSNNVQFATADPILRTALWQMWHARPAAVPFAELLAATRGQRTDGGPSRELADGLLQLYLANVIGLHLHPPTLATKPGSRPSASPFARLQAERGDLKIYNLCHVGINPDAFARYLLPLLDGQRTPAELVNVLAARAAGGEFAVHDNAGQAVTDPDRIRPVLSAWIETALDQLANAALLNKI